MKNLCRYIFGAGVAFGVEFGPPDVWPQIEKLGGVPLRIREFKDGAAISESTLTSVHKGPVDPTLFEVPEGYSRKDSRGRPLRAESAGPHEGSAELSHPVPAGPNPDARDTAQLRLRGSGWPVVP
jgi:hypothetical protein